MEWGNYMGTYLNPGNSGFERIVRSGCNRLFFRIFILTLFVK